MGLPGFERPHPGGWSDSAIPYIVKHILVTLCVQLVLSSNTPVSSYGISELRWFAWKFGSGGDTMGLVAPFLTSCHSNTVALEVVNGTIMRFVHAKELWSKGWWWPGPH